MYCSPISTDAVLIVDWSLPCNWQMSSTHNCSLY
jgi:hypothetical protein